MDVAQQVRELTRRVQALEDERAICRTLVRYGFAVDSDDPEATAALYTRATASSRSIATCDSREATASGRSSPVSSTRPSSRTART